MMVGGRSALTLASLIAFVGLGANCSIILDLDAVQCATDDDCETVAGATYCDIEEGICVGGEVEWTEPWECLGLLEVKAPEPGVTHIFRTQLVDAILQDRPPNGMSVRLCSAIDVACTNPVMTNIEYDSTGLIELEVADGFDGYLEVETPDASPYLVQFGGPIIQDVVEVRRPIPIITDAAFSAILANIDVVIDPALPLILLGTRNCLGERTSGVVYDISSNSSPDTQLFYLTDSIPNTDLTASDPSGAAIIVNAQPGYFQIDVSRAEDGSRIGVHELLTRNEWVSFTTTPPTP